MPRRGYFGQSSTSTEVPQSVSSRPHSKRQSADNVRSRFFPPLTTCPIAIAKFPRPEFAHPCSGAPSSCTLHSSADLAPESFHGERSTYEKFQQPAGPVLCTISISYVCLQYEFDRIPVVALQGLSLFGVPHAALCMLRAAAHFAERAA